VDNDQLLREIRITLSGFEAVTIARIDGSEARMAGVLDALGTRIGNCEDVVTRLAAKLDTVTADLLRVIVGNGVELHNYIEHRCNKLDEQLESIDRRLELHVGILSHLTEWSNKFETEMLRLSKELADVRVRLAKLENPNAHS
jgi:hypothetical protein